MRKNHIKRNNITKKVGDVVIDLTYNVFNIVTEDPIYTYEDFSYADSVTINTPEGVFRKFFKLKNQPLLIDMQQVFADYMLQGGDINGWSNTPKSDLKLISFNLNQISKNK